MMNEMFVAVCLYHMFVFANPAQTPETKQRAGISFIVIVLTCIGLNVSMALFFAIRRTYLKIKNSSLKPTKMKGEIELADPNAATVVNYKRRYEDQFGKVKQDGEELSSYNQEDSESVIEEYEAYRNI